MGSVLLGARGPGKAEEQSASLLCSHEEGTSDWRKTVCELT